MNNGMDIEKKSAELAAEVPATEVEAAEAVSKDISKAVCEAAAAADADTGMRKDIQEVLYREEDLQAIIQRLGAEISRDYAGKNLLLVSILKGSVITMADLMRSITIPCQIEFMVVSSYGKGTTTTGAVKIIKDLDHSIEPYDVLIVEDILDSGVTLNYLRGILLSRKPKSLKICTLLDKPEGRRVELAADYVGTNIPNAFIVGYGLDYAERYRNLPYIGILRKSVYEHSSEEGVDWAPVRNAALEEKAEADTDASDAAETVSEISADAEPAQEAVVETENTVAETAAEPESTVETAAAVTEEVVAAAEVPAVAEVPVVAPAPAAAEAAKKEEDKCADELKAVKGRCGSH